MPTGRCIVFTARANGRGRRATLAGARTTQTARKYLGTIGLPGSVHEHAIHTLSGGQKSRVVLVELQLTKCHILLLDVCGGCRRCCGGAGETRGYEGKAAYRWLMPRPGVSWWA